MNSWTYGVELEWPDIDPRTAQLLPGWDWSKTDFTIVSSDGWANDPTRKFPMPGGELNSAPYESVEGLVDHVTYLQAKLNPGQNYRSNLHVHIRIPGLEEDVETLKRMVTYTRQHLMSELDNLDPLETLLRDQPDEGAVLGARVRLRHSELSRHYFLPEERHQLRLKADSVEAFCAAEMPDGYFGGPRRHLAHREGINFRSLHKHGTIEFRCFADTRSIGALHSAVSFAHEWLWAAMHDGDPQAIIREWKPLLPRQLPYNHRLECGWRRTNLQNHPRAEIAALLREEGRL